LLGRSCFRCCHDAWPPPLLVQIAQFVVASTAYEERPVRPDEATLIAKILFSQTWIY
jgi:hypothetical protein